MKPNPVPISYTINRTAKLPLVFEGQRMAMRTSYRKDSNRHTVVELYLTTNSKYVGQISNFDRDKPDYPRIRAEYFEHPDGLIAWLKNDTEGTLGRLAVGALREAGESDSGLKAAFMEVVP